MDNAIPIPDVYIGVSKNNGIPKSSIFIEFSILNHPFWGTPILGNIHIPVCRFEWGQVARSNGRSSRSVAKIPKNIVGEPGVPWLSSMTFADQRREGGVLLGFDDWTCRS